MFGYNARLPASLASDDLLDSELVHQGESVGNQNAASQAWMKNKDAEMVSSAVRKKTRVSDSKKLSIGDWVILGLRLAGHGQVQRLERTRNHPRGEPSDNSLWISLKGHLVKASREQVRPATAEEHLGAELIQELSR